MAEMGQNPAERSITVFDGGEGTKNDLQELVDGNGQTPIIKLEVTIWGNGIGADLTVLAALNKLRRLEVEFRLDLVYEPNILNDDLIKAWAATMPDLEVLRITYDRQPYMEHMPTMTSFQTLATSCPKLRFLTISINAAQSTPLSKPITPFTNMKSLWLPSFPLWAKDYEAHAEELAALCPTISRFRIGQNEGYAADEFERDPKRESVFQFWSALEDSFQAIGGGGDAFAEARRMMMLQALLP